MGDALATEQTSELRRVVTRFTPMLLSWARDRIATGNAFFYLIEPTNFIGMHYPVAPDTVGRVLRYLRASGQLDYVVRNRSKSSYELLAVCEAS
jgi:hypothetical protein